MDKKKLKPNNNRDIDFLYEIGSLRFIQRTWRQFFHGEVANNSEHIFRVCFIALLIARREKVKNEEKILKMALMHDIGESRTPDTNYLSKIYSSRDEKKAIKHMLEATAFSKDFTSLYHEYEARSTIEAKIVKDADLLDVDLELQEQFYKGNQLKKLWAKKRKNIYKKFYTKSAKKIWEELYKTNPQEWHLKENLKHKEK